MYTNYSTPISPLSDVALQSPKDSVLLPPSSALPPLSKLSSFASHRIFRALDDLKNLYWPPKTHSSPTAASVVPSNLVLPTRKLKHLQAIHDHSVPDSGYASAEEETDDEDEEGLVEGQDLSLDEPDERAEILRGDPFERAFAVKWVTGFIAKAEIWVEEACEEDEGTGECEDGETASGEWKNRQEALDKATVILSLFIGDEALGQEDSAVTRSFSFPFGSGGEVQQHVKVELNDDPLDSADHTSVGLQSWASAVVMSEKMSADPQAFSLGSPGAEGEKADRRILELGAGTGLLSIVTAKILELQSRLQSDIISSKPMTKTNVNTIIATDFHPDVLTNCTRNVETNFPSNHRSASTRPAVLVHKLDWEQPDYSYPVDEPFDLILAADVIYHPEHAKWIRGVVERLLKKPLFHSSEDNLSNATVGGIFWMMMAVRSTGRHEGLDKTVDEVFPSVTTSTSGATAHVVDYEDNGRFQLAITHRAEFVKQGGLGRADEGGYKLFGIEWVPSTRV